jgi:hypothetical protein
MSNICSCCHVLPAQDDQVRLLKPAARIAFCTSCDLAGCTGVDNCRVGNDARADVLKITIADEMFCTIFKLKTYWWDAQQSGNTTNLWVQLTETCWRRYTKTSLGWIISEVAKISLPTEEYIAQAFVLNSPTSYYRNSWLRRFNAESLSQAQSDCDELCKELNVG